MSDTGINYYILLDLSPTVDDWPTIEQRIAEKKKQWNRGRNQGAPAVRKSATVYLALLSDLQEKLKDPRQRKAIAAQAQLIQERDRVEKFKKLDEAINVLGGRCSRSQIPILSKSVGLTENEVESHLRQRGVPIEDAEAQPAPPLEPRLDSSTMKGIRLNLDRLKLDSLYEFLELPKDCSCDVALKQANQLFKRLNVLTPSPENDARKELACSALAVFRSQAEREKYDRSLADEKMHALKPLLNVAGDDRVITSEVMDRLIDVAREKGVDPNEAVAFIRRYAHDKKWTILPRTENTRRDRENRFAQLDEAIRTLTLTLANLFLQEHEVQEYLRRRGMLTTEDDENPSAAPERATTSEQVERENDSSTGGPRCDTCGFENAPEVEQCLACGQPTTPSRERSRVYGIDLGTTHSCISYVDDHGRPVEIKNSEGDSTTPSVVYFESPGNVVVGKYAKEYAWVHLERVISNVKRVMGDSNWEFECDGGKYKPEEVSALILGKLVQDARMVVGEEIRDVVMTCPAYFGFAQREATKCAGEIAGLNVLAVLPEPTAAALAYGIEQERDQTILVFDLGGGTFDVTLVRIKGREEFRVISTNGDDRLGGKDWDEVIVSLLAEEFSSQTGTPADDLLDDPETYQGLLIRAEEIKKKLSVGTQHVELVIFGTDRARVTLTREKFEELTRQFLEKTIAFTEEALERGRWAGVSSPDKILLVGGSSFMPQVMERLKRFVVEKQLDAEILLRDPHLVVAKGAALWGEMGAVGRQISEGIAHVG